MDSIHKLLIVFSLTRCLASKAEHSTLPRAFGFGARLQRYHFPQFCETKPSMGECGRFETDRESEPEVVIMIFISVTQMSRGELETLRPLSQTHFECEVHRTHLMHKRLATISFPLLFF